MHIAHRPDGHAAVARITGLQLDVEAHCPAFVAANGRRRQIVCWPLTTYNCRL